jgi:RecG-like helicase
VPAETALKIKTKPLHRLTAEREALHAEELQAEIVEISAKPIGDCGDREVVDVAGILRTVTLRPRGPSLTMEADLWDGTGNITLVWLGRRDIKGIRPGRRLVVRGRVARIKGERTIYNPQYELQPSAVDASAADASIADLPSPG